MAHHRLAERIRNPRPTVIEERKRAVLDHLRDHGPATLVQLADALDVSRASLSSARFAVENLIEEGLVCTWTDRTEAGRWCRLYDLDDRGGDP